MVHSTRKGFRALVLLMVVLSLALAACSSSAATTKPKNTPKASQAVATEKASSDATEKASAEATEEATEQASEEATEQPSSGDGTGLSGADKNFSKIESYKFSMEMAGGMFKDYGALLGGASGDSFKMTGVVVTKPVKASSVDFMGFKIVDYDGASYMNMGGSWIKSDSGSSITDSLSPEKMFSSYVGAGAAGYKADGEGKKNGVDALKFTASPDEMKDYGSLLGVEGAADWTAEVWIAKDGGYPVSVSIQAKQSSTVAFKMVFDITDVNSSSNKVEKPNV